MRDFAGVTAQKEDVTLNLYKAPGFESHPKPGVVISFFLGNPSNILKLLRQQTVKV